MALNKEDKKDVSKAMGKALANKVESATQDKPRKDIARFQNKMSKIFGGGPSKLTLRQNADREAKRGFYAPDAVARREQENKEYKEVVRKYHADREAGLNPKNPFL